MSAILVNKLDLHALIARVIIALGDKSMTDGVYFEYGSCDGTWLWTVVVRATFKPHGRGAIVARARMQEHGETPEIAVEGLLRKLGLRQRKTK